MPNNKNLIVLGLLFYTSIALAQTTGSFTFGGVLRDYIIHAPSGLTNAALVLNMHGLGSNASQQQLYTRFDQIADREGFIVVYPNGANKTWDITGNNDVNFLTALVDTMKAHYSIDLNRVYATGFSMGGYMSHRLGCAAANKFAAIAPVSGLNATYNCSPARPIPVLQIHGTTDTVVRYSGVASTISGWVNRNGCPQTAQVTEPYPSTNPASTVRKDYYGTCNQNSEVILLSVVGAGHVWPGGYGASFGINAGEEAWAFFKNHTLSTATRQSTAKTKKTGPSILVVRDTHLLRIQCLKQVQCIRMLDIQGKTIARWTVPAGSDQIKTITVQRPDMTEGVYMIVAETRDMKDAAAVLIP